MKNKKRLISLLVSILALLALTSLASAGPGNVGTPTIRWRATSDPNISEIRVDGLTNDGAIGYDMYFRFDHTMGGIASAAAGPAWSVICPSSFNFVLADGMPSGAGSTGTNGVLLNAFCTTPPTGGVTGSDIVVATVTFQNCAPGGFLVDLDSGDDVFGGSVVDFVDQADPSTPYVLTDNDMTDGGACGNPTAVTLANVSAGPVSSPSNALYLAFAGALALLAAAGLALRGVRKH